MRLRRPRRSPRPKRPKRPRRPKRRISVARARVHDCQDGADVVCPCGFTLRLRVCMDGRRRVRVMGTAAAGDTMIRATLTRRSVKVTPVRYAACIKRCVAKARPALTKAQAAYMQRFSPQVRSLVRLG